LLFLAVLLCDPCPSTPGRIRERLWGILSGQRNGQCGLSLKNGVVVQVTLASGKTGLEEFWQLSRANGAKPHSPVELATADMEWLGLAAKVSPAEEPG
jgi:hypothetical protein